MSHKCAAFNCQEIVPDRMLMCRRHWYMVPTRIRNDVWRHYKPGQESGKTEASLAYRYAIGEAISAVRIKERNNEHRG